MITFSGVHIQKIGGAEGTPTAQDIAVQSGRICRYAGAVWMPLLTHLVFVGLLAYRRSGSVVNLLWGKLHDAQECGTGEIPQPFKCDCIRREQSALDVRIIAKFIGSEQEPLIDYALIKQCDRHALDLEAIELGLPNYEAIAAPIHDWPLYKNVDDRRLLLNILKSPFYRNTTSQFSPGVIAFQDALSLAEGRKYDEFLQAVRSWNLL